MILIVGHGPSNKNVTWKFIDSQTVVRLATGRMLQRRYSPGNKTDVICRTARVNPIKVRGSRFWHNDIEVWKVEGELKNLCYSTLEPFTKTKPSTGLCAAIIARDKYTDEEIGVIGFDYTMHPERAKDWLHDAHAENRCIQSLRVVEYGQNS